MIRGRCDMMTRWWWYADMMMMMVTRWWWYAVHLLPRWIGIQKGRQMGKCFVKRWRRRPGWGRKSSSSVPKQPLQRWEKDKTAIKLCHIFKTIPKDKDNSWGKRIFMSFLKGWLTFRPQIWKITQRWCTLQCGWKPFAFHNAVQCYSKTEKP